MISDLNTTGKADLRQVDAQQLEKLLELELMQKRAEWKKTSARNRSVRVSSFVFLFVLVAATILAFMFLISKVSEQRMNGASPHATANP